MKRVLATTLAACLTLCLGACTIDLGLPDVQLSFSENGLVVSEGQNGVQQLGEWSIAIRGAQKDTLSRHDAMRLADTELTIDGELYRGIALTALLEDVGAGNFSEVSMVGAGNQRIQFAAADINSRILLSWSKNYRVLNHPMLVTKMWGKTRTLAGVHTIIITGE